MRYFFKKFSRIDNEITNIRSDNNKPFIITYYNNDNISMTFHIYTYI